MDKAHEEGNKEMSVLKKPFRIELRKTAVVASYRAYLVGVSGQYYTVAFNALFTEWKFTCTMYVFDRYLERE